MYFVVPTQNGLKHGLPITLIQMSWQIVHGKCTHEYLGSFMYSCQSLGATQMPLDR